MQTANVIHGYYKVGGRAMVDAMVDVDDWVNTRIEPVPVALQRSVPYLIESDLQELTRESVKAYRVPAFRFSEPDNLKLSLFYITGQSGRLGYLNSQLIQNRYNRHRNQHGQTAIIPWGNKGVVDYLNQNYGFDRLVFNSLRYQYMGTDSADRPLGALRLVLDADNPVNETFFEAQELCTRAVKAIVSRRVKVETADSIQIGQINIQNTTSEFIETVVSDISVGLKDRPVEAAVGQLVLKHKSQ